MEIDSAGAREAEIAGRPTSNYATAMGADLCKTVDTLADDTLA